jgi:hypothetical protein
MSRRRCTQTRWLDLSGTAKAKRKRGGASSSSGSWMDQGEPGPIEFVSVNTLTARALSSFYEGASKKNTKTLCTHTSSTFFKAASR